MLGSIPVIDGVVHPYNLGPDNLNPQAIEQVRNIYSHHRMWQPPGRGFVMNESDFISNIDLDAISNALFAESPVDIAILHALPSLGFTTGQVTTTKDMARLRDRNPGRYIIYGTVTTPVLEDAIAEFRSQVEDYGVVGLKLYPVFFYGGKSYGWLMSDPNFTVPLIKAARDMGIRNVAVHKAIAVGPASIETFRVSDVEVPAAAFPDVNFQVVHAGLSFLEDACLLMHRFKNVYANLEIPWNFSATRPEVFAEILGELLYWSSPQQIMYGDGCNLVHPLPGIEAFASFEMPDHLIRGRGYQKLSAEDKALILGGNAARIHNLDVQQMRNLSGEDQFEVSRASGFRPPWSRLGERVVEVRN
jgi:predicted TIM-barrel fold metal-dependent hydrolase